VWGVVGTVLTLIGFAGAFMAKQKMKQAQRAKEAGGERTQMTQKKPTKMVL
jgi:hypothetical protein